MSAGSCSANSSLIRAAFSLDNGVVANDWDEISGRSLAGIAR